MTRLRHANGRQNGAVLIVVIVCLIITSTILLGAVRLSIRHRVQLRTESQLEQTYWLLDAGVGKALERFQQQPKFDNFVLETEGAIKGHTGSINIVVVERGEESVRVRVTAKLEKTDSNGPITQRSRIILIKKNTPVKDNTNNSETDTETDNDNE